MRPFRLFLVVLAALAPSMKVVVADVDATGVNSGTAGILREGIQATFMKLDVSDGSQVMRLLRLQPPGTAKSTFCVTQQRFFLSEPRSIRVKHNGTAFWPSI